MGFQFLAKVTSPDTVVRAINERLGGDINDPDVGIVKQPKHVLGSG